MASDDAEFAAAIAMSLADAPAVPSPAAQIRLPEVDVDAAVVEAPHNSHARAPAPAPQHFAIKHICWGARFCPILLQNLNGPCPLLAIANILLLRNCIEIPESAASISIDHLLALVAEYIVASNSSSVQTQGAAAEVLVDDALGVLPRLSRGLDVNVRFDACDGFEFTQEMCVFDMCKIGLYHCWVYDAQKEPDVAAAMGRRHYNEAVLTLFNSIGAGSSPPASDTAAAISAAGGVADPEHLESLLSQVNLNDGDVPCDRQHAAVPLESAKAVQSQPHAAGADAAAVDRFCIRNWMQSTASQFTEFGFRQLKAKVRPNELFALFRNNHFSVGFKRGDEIYLLETDISFRATAECWSLPGLLSCVFVGEDFMPVDRAPNSPSPIQQQHQRPAYQQNHLPPPPNQPQQQQHHPPASPQHYNSYYEQSLAHQYQQHDDELRHRQQQQVAAATSNFPHHSYSGRALSIEEQRELQRLASQDQLKKYREQQQQQYLQQQQQQQQQYLQQQQQQQQHQQLQQHRQAAPSPAAAPVDYRDQLKAAKKAQEKKSGDGCSVQ